MQSDCDCDYMQIRERLGAKALNKEEKQEKYRLILFTFKHVVMTRSICHVLHTG